MTVDKPADTYFDTRGLTKGQMWLGTRNLGRFWSIGPVYTLYAPAPWMKRGVNRVTVFDLQGDSAGRLATARAPIFGSTTDRREAQ